MTGVVTALAADYIALRRRVNLPVAQPGACGAGLRPSPGSGLRGPRIFRRIQIHRKGTGSSAGKAEKLLS